MEIEQAIAPQVSPETGEQLKLNKRRNKILAWVFLVEILFSLPEIFLIKSAPNRIELITYIFDVIYILPVLYFVVQMFRQKDVLRVFFWVALLNTFVSAILIILNPQKQYIGLLIEFLFAVFYSFYIKSALTIKNFRIAAFILLPLFALSLAGVIAYYANQGYVQGKDQKAASDSVINFIKSAPPEQQAFSDILVEKDASKLQEETLKLQKINNDRLAQLNDTEAVVEQAKSKTTDAKLKERNNAYLDYLEANKKQMQKMSDFCDYAAGLDFVHLTAEQGQTNLKYINEISQMATDVLDKFQKIQ